MTKEKRTRKRNALRRMQKQRVEWKKAHPQEAKERAIANALDSEKRAITRAERLANRADRKERKREAYLKRREAVSAAKVKADAVKSINATIRASRKATPADKPRRGFLANLFRRVRPVKVGA